MRIIAVNHFLALTAWMRRYGITLLILGIALLSARSVMAADNGTTSFSETAQSFIGGVIASTIINLIVGRGFKRAENKADNATAKVNNLAKELGVDDPKKVTPDVTKLEAKVGGLEKDLTTVKNELVRTLEERDSAREQVAKQLEKNTQDSVSAQTQIDQLTRDRDEERQTSARLEQLLRDQDQRFRDQELKMARLEGRLDQQSIQDQLSGTMQTVAKLLDDVSKRVTAQSEGMTT